MIGQPKIEIPAVTKATATFDPPVVRPGQKAFLRVVLNALEQSIAWPTNLAGPPQLEMRPGAHEQILQMTGANMEPRTAFNYRIRASRPGSYTVPEFVVEVDGKPVTVPPARLEVVSDASTALPPAPQLTLELTATNLFVGQTVAARVVLPGSPAGLVQGLGQPQLSGQGFLVDGGAARQRFEMVPRGGTIGAIFIYETALTPVRSGKLTVLAQGFTAGNRFSSPVVITGPPSNPGGWPQYTLLESEPVELNVRPLPREGELPGFTGAIGSQRPARRRSSPTHGQHCEPRRWPFGPAGRPAAAAGARLAGGRCDRVRSCATYLTAAARPATETRSAGSGWELRGRGGVHLHPHPAHRSRARDAAHTVQLL